jgi:hypothetical protein
VQFGSEMVERQELPGEALANLAYARRRDGNTEAKGLQFISWALRLDRPPLVLTALETANIMYCFGEALPPMPEEPLLSLILSPSVLHGNDHARYQWAEVTQRFVEEFPRHAMAILESVFMKFDDHDFMFRLTHSQVQNTMMNLIRNDPHESWRIVIRLMDPLGETRARNTAHWLGPGYAMGDTVTAGPLAAFHVGDVLTWVAAAPEERAHFIIRECPKTFDANAGGALTREILIRYGDQERVRQALSENFGTEGWSGSASAHFRKKRDKLREWLSVETEKPIVDWLQEEIAYVGRQIKANEIREEREF